MPEVCPSCGEPFDRSVTTSRHGTSRDVSDAESICVYQRRVGGRAMKATKDYTTTVYIHK